MESLDPKDIPEIIVLVSEMYMNITKKRPSEEQKKKISIFFMKYMGKAIEECQNLSKTHWTVAHEKKDVAFRTKTVLVESKENGGKVEFIVGTSYGPQFGKDDLDNFRKNTEEKVLEKYADPVDGSWVMVFNSLMFDNKRHGDFVAGLFIGIRFSKEHFISEESSEPPQVH
jgi:hypothetical protein